MNERLLVSLYAKKVTEIQESLIDNRGVRTQA